MSEYTIHIRLKVLSPLHIGCGEDYEPIEFVVNDQARTLIAFNPVHFLGSLDEKELQSYSAICRKGTVPSLLEVYKFIRLHKDKVQGREIKVSEAFVKHYDKVLKLDAGNVQQHLNKFQVNRTAYQRMDGRPYIPGTAVKGALRTAVLNFRSNTQRQLKTRNGKDLNDTLAGGTFAQDPFRCVKVSDFLPMGSVNSRIVYAVNRKKKPSEKQARGPYQLLEVIEAGSELLGSISILEPHGDAKIQYPVSLGEITQALDSFYSSLQQEDQRMLQSIGCRQQEYEPEKGAPVRLGKHSGAEAVTVDGYRDIKIMQGPGKRPKYMKQATTTWLASPADNPSGNSALQPFGWALLSRLTHEESRIHNREKKTVFDHWLADRQREIAKTKEQARIAAEREESRRSREQAEQAARRKREQEIAEFPWRGFLPNLAKINDWGAFKTQVLEQNAIVEYQNIAEVGSAVAQTAIRIAAANPRKWDAERDGVLLEWLAPSGIAWENQAKSVDEQEPIVMKIKTFARPADYDRTLDIASLPLEGCQTLAPLFKKWNWNKKKKAKKSNYELWVKLQQRIDMLKDNK